MGKTRKIEKININYNKIKIDESIEITIFIRKINSLTLLALISFYI